MIGVLVSFLLIFLNPFKQIEKARDSQRLLNLKQINNALDTYYNDNNCYPLSLSFGSSWQQGSAVYMQQIPQDPSCSGGGSCYSYVTDTSSTCPSWNILFTKIYQSTANTSSCALEQLSNCLPSNYASSGYNYCVLSGKVDCAYINSISLPADAGAGTGGGTGGGGSTPTPSPTPIVHPPGSCPCATAQYDIRAGNCNVVSNAPYVYCDNRCTILCY